MEMMIVTTMPVPTLLWALSVSFLPEHMKTGIKVHGEQKGRKDVKPSHFKNWNSKDRLCMPTYIFKSRWNEHSLQNRKTLKLTGKPRGRNWTPI